MKRSIQIHSGIVEGVLEAPPSKSITHRLLIMAALSGHPCRIRRPLHSEDTLVTLQGLQKMGYDFYIHENDFVFTGKHRIPETNAEIHVGNSGTSARFLTALAAIQSFPSYIDGSERMRQRPMQPLISALKRLGTTIEDRDGYLPIKIAGYLAQGCEIDIDASQSSQFLSALLLIAPRLHAGLRLVHHGQVASEPYARMTIALMQKAGIPVRTQQEMVHAPGMKNYLMADSRVEGDYSSAAYFLVAAAITGGSITIRHLTRNSVQGDRAILDILQAAGARVEWHSDGVTVSGGSLKGIDVDMHHYPDLVPTVAVLALFATTPTRLRNVEQLRYKESDRIQAVIENITRLGGHAYLEGNDLVIEPRSLHGARISTFNDHRIAMSFALVGLRVPEVEIENPDCVRKSYPDFWEHFKAVVKTKSRSTSKSE